MLYKMIDLPSDQPVQFVGVYVMHWGKESEPTVAFREATEEEIKAEVDKVSGWRSMDTAPRDGTPILVIDGTNILVSDRKYVIMAAWEHEYDNHKPDDKKDWVNLATYNDEFGVFQTVIPVAWMPLPEVVKK